MFDMPFISTKDSNELSYFRARHCLERSQARAAQQLDRVRGNGDINRPCAEAQVSNALRGEHYAARLAVIQVNYGISFRNLRRLQKSPALSQLSAALKPRVCGFRVGLAI
jgi:hypothetical protein